MASTTRTSPRNPAPGIPLHERHRKTHWTNVSQLDDHTDYYGRCEVVTSALSRTNQGTTTSHQLLPLSIRPRVPLTGPAKKAKTDNCRTESTPVRNCTSQIRGTMKHTQSRPLSQLVRQDSGLLEGSAKSLVFSPIECDDTQLIEVGSWRHPMLVQRLRGIGDPADERPGVHGDHIFG